MYEYQEKKISKIAKTTAEILSQYVGHYARPEEEPESDPVKIETCMIDAIYRTADLTEMCFENRRPAPEAKTQAIGRFLNIVLNISHIWQCGYYAHEAELIEIVEDELSERRRSAIRDSFRDTWDDEPDPETTYGECQQDLIDMYRRER